MLTQGIAAEKRLNRRSLSGQFRKDFLCPIRQTSFLLTQTAMKHGTPRGQPRITVVQKTERVVGFESLYLAYSFLFLAGAVNDQFGILAHATLHREFRFRTKIEETVLSASLFFVFLLLNYFTDPVFF